MAPRRSTDAELAAFLAHRPSWTIEAGKLRRTFRLGSYGAAIELIEACRVTIDRLDHHPDWTNRYGVVDVALSTHAIEAISHLDLELAETMERIASEPRVIAVDWSGRVQGSEETIWIAEARGESLVRLEPGRTREQVTEWLLAQLGVGPPLIVGLDFAFSLPAWFARAHGCATGPEVWQLAARLGERWLSTCPPPFWGHAGTTKPTDVATRRRADAVGAKSPFQIAGAGAVGTGSIRGMPHLARLRRGGFAVWPFDRPRLPVIVEIYPRVHTGPVVKSRAAARAAAVEALPLNEAHRRLAIGSEDAFDAALSALAMHRRLDELLDLPVRSGADIEIEGEIWS